MADNSSELKRTELEPPKLEVDFANSPAALKAKRDAAADEAKRKDLDKELESVILIHGEEHPAVASKYHEIGEFLVRFPGKSDHSRRALEKALALRQKLFGEASEAAIDTHYVIGQVMGRINTEKEITRLHLMKTLALREQLDSQTGNGLDAGLTLPELDDDSIEALMHSNNEDLLDSTLIYSDLAEDARTRGNYLVAQPLYEKALQLRRIKYGDISAPVIQSLLTYAQFLRDRAQYMDCKYVLEEALASSVALHGQEHITVADCNNSLGQIVRLLGDLVGSEAYYQKALMLRRKLLGDFHVNVAGTLNNLAELYSETGDYMLAIQYHKAAIEIFEKTVGVDHPGTINAKGNLGITYRRQSKEGSELAEKLVTDAVQYLHLQQYNESHPWLIKFQSEFLLQQARQLGDGGKHDESFNMFDSVLNTKRDMAIRSNVDIIAAEEGLISSVVGKAVGLTFAAKYQEANNLYVDYFDKMAAITVLKAYNPHLIELKLNYGENLVHMADFESAKSVFMSCLQVCVSGSAAAYSMVAGEVDNGITASQTPERSVDILLIEDAEYAPEEGDEGQQHQIEEHGKQDQSQGILETTGGALQTEDGAEGVEVAAYRQEEGVVELLPADHVQENSLELLDIAHGEEPVDTDNHEQEYGHDLIVSFDADATQGTVRTQLVTNQQLARQEEEQIRAQNDLNRLRALVNLGNWCRAQGIFPDALEYFTQATMYTTAMLDKQPLNVASTADKNAPLFTRTYLGMAELQRNMGAYKECEFWLNKTKKVYQHRLDRNHVLKADALSCEANLMMAKCCYKDARGLVNECLNIRHRAYGNSHPQIATAYMQLASLSLLEHDYPEAEAMAQQADQMRQEFYCEVTGCPSHPALGNSLYILARVDEHLCRYTEAVKKYKDAQELFSVVLKPDHPVVARIMVGIAEIYLIKGETPVAEKFLQEALLIQDNYLTDSTGRTHLHLGLTNQTLARCMQYQGKAKRALVFSEDALSIRIRTALSIHHADIIASKLIIADLLTEKGAMDKAKEKLKEVTKHLTVLFCANNKYDQEAFSKCLLVSDYFVSLAGLCSANGLYLHAKTLYSRAYGIRYRVLGPHHARSLYIQCEAANNIRKPGYFLAAQFSLSDVFEVLNEHFAEQIPYDHVFYITAMRYQALLQLDTHSYSDAQTTLQTNCLKALVSNTNIMPQANGDEATQPLFNNNSFIASLYFDLGEYYRLSGNPTEALKTFTKCGDMRKDLFGDKTIPVADVWHAKAMVLYSQNNMVQALKFLKELVLPVYETAFNGAKHPVIMNIKANIGLCMNGNKVGSGQELLDEAALYFDHYGQSPFAADHPWVLSVGGYTEPSSLERISTNITDSTLFAWAMPRFEGDEEYGAPMIVVEDESKKKKKLKKKRVEVEDNGGFKNAEDMYDFLDDLWQDVWTATEDDEREAHERAVLKEKLEREEILRIAEEKKKAEEKRIQEEKEKAAKAAEAERLREEKRKQKELDKIAAAEERLNKAAEAKQRAEMKAKEAAEARARMKEEKEAQMELDREAAEEAAAQAAIRAQEEAEEQEAARLKAVEDEDARAFADSDHEGGDHAPVVIADDGDAASNAAPNDNGGGVNIGIVVMKDGDGTLDSSLEEEEEEELSPEELAVKKALEAAEFIFNRANELHREKKYTQCIPLYEEALYTRELHLPNDDARIIEIVFAMGQNYSKMRDFDKAHDYYQLTCDYTIDKHGYTSIEVSDALLHLVRNFEDMGKVLEAHDHLQQSIDIRIDVIGSDDVNMVPLYVKQVQSLLFLSKTQEAKYSADNAYAIAFKAYGNKKIETANTIMAKAETFTALGKFTEAKPLIEQATAMRRNMLGAEDLLVAEGAMNMAKLFVHLGNFDEAITNFKKARGIFLLQNSIEDENIQVLDIRFRMAQIQVHIGNIYDGLKEHYTILNIQLKYMYPDHYVIADSYHALGEIYCKLFGNYTVAQMLYSKAMNIRLNSFGDSHLKITESKMAQGELFRRTGRLDEAKKLLEECAEDYRNILSKEHPLYYSVMIALADLSANMGDNKEASKSYRRTLKVQKKHLGADHSDVAFTVAAQAEMARIVGNMEEFAQFNKEAIEMLKHCFHEDHWGVQVCLSNEAMLLLTNTFMEMQKEPEVIEEEAEELKAPEIDPLDIVHKSKDVEVADKFVGTPAPEPEEEAEPKLNPESPEWKQNRELELGSRQETVIADGPVVENAGDGEPEPDSTATGTEENATGGVEDEFAGVMVTPEPGSGNGTGLEYVDSDGIRRDPNGVPIFDNSGFIRARAMFEGCITKLLKQFKNIPKLFTVEDGELVFAPAVCWDSTAENFAVANESALVVNMRGNVGISMKIEELELERFITKQSTADRKAMRKKIRQEERKRLQALEEAKEDREEEEAENVGSTAITTATTNTVEVDISGGMDKKIGAAEQGGVDADADEGPLHKPEEYSGHELIDMAMHWMERQGVQQAHPWYKKFNAYFIPPEKPPDEIEIARSVRQRGLEKQRQGLYGDAEVLFMEAYNILKDCLDPVVALTHMDVAHTVLSMADCARIQGRYKPSKQWYAESMLIYRKVNGEHCPGVTDCMHGLGVLVYTQGFYDDALSMLEQCLSTRVMLYGLMHTDVAKTQVALAENMRRLGQYEQARALVDQALSVPNCAPEDVGVAYTVQGKLDLAYGKLEKCHGSFQKALELVKGVFGAEHPDTATVLHSISEYEFLCGKLESAKSTISKVIKIRSKTFGRKKFSMDKNADEDEANEDSGAIHRENLEDDPDLQGVATASDLIMEDTEDVESEAPAVSKLEESTHATLANAMTESLQSPPWVYRGIPTFNHLLIAESLYVKANICLTTGEWTDAKALFDNAYAIRYEIISRNSTLSGDSLFGKAKYCKATGNLKQALEYHTAAAQQRRQLLGEEHPDVADSLYYTAEVELLRGSLDDALRHFGDSHTVRKKVYAAAAQEVVPEIGAMSRPPSRPNSPTNNPSTKKLMHYTIAESICGCAQVYQLRGEYHRAKDMYDKAYYMMKHTLGEGHLKMSNVCLCMAENLLCLGQYEMSMALVEQVMSIRTVQLGDDHVDCSACYMLIADILRSQGKYLESKKLLEQCMVVRRAKLGKAHPDTALTLIAVGNNFHDLAKYDAAKPVFERATHLLKLSFNPESHWLIAEAWTYTAENCRMLGDFAQAKLLHEQALMLRRKIFNDQHRSISDSVYYLAMLVLQTTSKYDDAIKGLDDSLAYRRNALGSVHRDVAQSLHSIGYAYFVRGQLQECKVWYDRADSMRKELFGSNHPDICESMHTAALLARKQGKLEQTAAILERCLASKQDLYGTQHSIVADTLYQLAEVHCAQGKYTLAKIQYTDCLGVRMNIFGKKNPHHPAIAESLFGMAECLRICGRFVVVPAKSISLLSYDAIVSVVPDRTKRLQGHPHDVLDSTSFMDSYAPVEEGEEGSVLSPLPGGVPDSFNRVNSLPPLRPESVSAPPSITLSQANEIAGMERNPKPVDDDEEATNYTCIDDIVSALPAYKRALAYRIQYFGPDHSLVLDSQFAIAETYRAMGRYKEAQLLYEQTLINRRKIVGEDHPDTAESLFGLAEMLRTLSIAYPEKPRVSNPNAPPEPLEVGMLTGFYRDPGALKAPHVTLEEQFSAIGYTSTHNFSSSFVQPSKFDLLPENLDEQGRPKILRLTNEPSTGAGRMRPRDRSVPPKDYKPGYMGFVYPPQKELVRVTQFGATRPVKVLMNDAVWLYGAAFDTLTRLYGEQIANHHPLTGSILFGKSELFKIRRDKATAKTLLDQALAMRRGVLKSDHPHIADILHVLAEGYRLDNQYVKALPLYQRALDIRKAAFSGMTTIHPTIADSLNSIGLLYYAQGNYLDAESMLRDALSMREQIYGTNNPPLHPSLAQSLNNLASVLHATGYMTEAENLYRKALAIKIDVYGSAHPDVALAMNNLALLLKDINNTMEAKSLFEDALSIQKNHFVVHHPDTAATMNNFASLLYAMKKYRDAKDMYRKSLQIKKDIMGYNHPSVASTMNNLAGLLLTLQEFDDARVGCVA